MRRFYWLGAGPVPASCDLRRLGWELLEGRGLKSSADRAPVIACARHMAVRQWIDLAAAPPDRRALAVITGVNDSHKRTHLLASGLGDAVAAGVHLEELAQRAGRVIARDAMLPARRKVGPLELDLLARDARRGGRSIGLNPREFALLWRLADQPGRAVSVSALLHEVWGLRFRPETNSLAVHICRLRAKLRIAGLDDAIATQDDGSYRLDLGQTIHFRLDVDKALSKDDSKRQTNTREQDKYHAA